MEQSWAATGDATIELVEVWSLLLWRRRRPTEVRRGESGEVQGSATLPSAEIYVSLLS